MIYKTELHCHTNLVSKCGKYPVEDIIEDYIALGYSTLVITDHFSPATFEDKQHLSWTEKCDFYLSGYKKAVDLSKGRINVLLGMEYRNIHTCNDYLVYGVNEDFFKKYNTDDNNNFISMYLKDFAEIVHRENMLIYQAHPFRDHMQIVPCGILDGIEIANAHKRHDSRNDIAKMWAEKYNLMVCGGSDCHQKGDEGRGGIVTDYVIKNNKDLLNTLKGEVNIIYPED